MQSLPPKLRDALSARGLEANVKLNGIIRNLDAKAFERMKATKTVYARTDAQRADWKAVVTKAVMQLRGTVFSPAMFDKIVGLAGNPYQSK